MSPFLVFGVSNGCFHFSAFSIEISVSKQCRPLSDDQRQHVAAPELGLHCLNNALKRVSCLKRVTRMS